MTRADYHRIAIKKMTGAKVTETNIVTDQEDKSSWIGFASTQWKVSEATESVTLTVERFGFVREPHTPSNCGDCTPCASAPRVLMWPAPVRSTPCR